MKRLNPVSSVFGVILVTLLFIGMGMSLFINRGLAFSPGPVTAKTNENVTINGFNSHAEFETQCGSCHEPLKTDLATKCLACHEQVNEEKLSGEGVHSTIIDINNCSKCHPDHRGRDFDPTLSSYIHFDHSSTSFSLNWHQENYDATPMQCSACHTGSDFSRVNTQICIDCHNASDQEFSPTHEQDYGSNCLACHDGLDRMQNFDHKQTSFALSGKHEQIKCTECHKNQLFIDTPSGCVDCHSEPIMHKGLFSQSCNECHTSEKWSMAKIDNQPFNHFTSAGFSLQLHRADYNDQAITCLTCHPENLQTQDVQICLTCHDQHDTVFMADHQQQFGLDCMNCHDGVDRLSNYDHNNFFPLDGMHANAECIDCHVNNSYRDTPTECTQCHQEPEIHAGVFGINCDDCHTAEAWSPATLLKHDFPLNHGLEDANLQSQCETCHSVNYIEYTCYTCHEHQPDKIFKTHISHGINEEQLPECIRCHPTGSDENP